MDKHTAYLTAHIDRTTLQVVGKLRVYSSPPWLLTVSSKGPIPVLLLKTSRDSFQEARDVLIEAAKGSWMFEPLLKLGVE